MRYAPAPLLTVAVAVTALGIGHGVATDRWGPSGQLERSVAALDRVPTTFGDWTPEPLRYDPEEMARAGIRAGLHRQYRNARTRESVSVLLICGRGGPLCVHTPEVCYAGTGYRAVGASTQKVLDLGEAGRHDFRVVRFTKPDGVPQAQLEIYLAWSRDGRTWTAPETPRASLARAPALYKLYVAREVLPNTRSEGDDAHAFLRRALPELRRTLPPE